MLWGRRVGGEGRWWGRKKEGIANQVKEPFAKTAHKRHLAPQSDAAFAARFAAIRSTNEIQKP